MPNNPLVDAFRYLFTGSPEQGPGLFSPQNIGNAMGQTGQDIQTIMAPAQRMPTVDVTATRIPQSAPTVPSIDVGALKQQFVQNMGAQQMAGTQQPKQGGGINWQMLMDIGIPALSAIVGTAAPSTLAGASGLSTGYTGAREKQRERQFELDKEEKKRKIEAEEIAKPTFGQKGKIEALKTGLKQGKIVIGKEFGEPQVYDVNKEGLEGALLAIQNAGLDPALFEAELTPYASQYASEYEKLIKSKNPKDLERARQLRDTLLSLPFVKEE